MVPSGTEFAPGRTVRILPRRSAEAALGRQRSPPRIDPKSSPRDLQNLREAGDRVSIQRETAVVTGWRRVGHCCWFLETYYVVLTENQS